MYSILNKHLDVIKLLLNNDVLLNDFSIINQSIMSYSLYHGQELLQFINGVIFKNKKYFPTLKSIFYLIHSIINNKGCFWMDSSTHNV